MEVPIIIQIFIGLGMLYTVIYNTRKTSTAVNAISTAASSVTASHQDVAGPVSDLNGLLRQMMLDRTRSDQFSQTLIERLQKRLDATEDTVSALKAQLLDRERRSDENKRQIEDLVTESQINQKERKELKERNERLEKDLNVVQDDLSAAQVKIKATEEKLNKTQIELDQARADLADAKKRLTILETQHTEDVAEKERLTAELLAKDNRIKELEARVKELETELANLRAKVNTEPPKEPSV